MTICVGIKTNSGIVLAADSASTFYKEDIISKIYYNATKIFEIYKGIPIGCSNYGLSSIGGKSFGDFISIFAKENRNELKQLVYHNNYSLECLARRFSNYIFQRYQASNETATLQILFGGYSASEEFPQLWKASILNGKLKVEEIKSVITWGGQCEALNRIILGTGDGLADLLTKDVLMSNSKESMSTEEYSEYEKRQTKEAISVVKTWQKELESPFVEPLMPIEDTAGLARFFVQSTIDFYKYSLYEKSLVGGAIDIVIITKLHGFQWFQKKF